MWYKYKIKLQTLKQSLNYGFISNSVSDKHRLVLYLYFLEPCVQAFQRDGLRGHILHALFIFSQLALQSPLTILISGDFKTNKAQQQVE